MPKSSALAMAVLHVKLDSHPIIFISLNPIYTEAQYLSNSTFRTSAVFFKKIAVRKLVSVSTKCNAGFLFTHIRCNAIGVNIISYFVIVVQKRIDGTEISEHLHSGMQFVVVVHVLPCCLVFEMLFSLD